MDAVCSDSRHSWLRVRLKAFRAFSFPVSVLPVLLAVAAIRPVSEWRWGVLIGSAIGAGLLHAAGNLLNDYFDHRSGVDRKVDGDEGRPGRLLVHGRLSPANVLTEAAVCLLLAGVVGAYLIWKCGPGLFWFAVAAVASLYAYTGPPLKLKYRAMGEPLIFLVFGPILMLGAAYAQTGRFEFSAMLISIPVGMATTAILVGNNIRDDQEDRESGIRTICHVAGQRATRIMYIALLLGCVLGLVAMVVTGLVPRVVALAPVLLLLVRKPLWHVWNNQRLADIDARTAKFESVLLVLLLLAFMIQGDFS